MTALPTDVAVVLAGAGVHIYLPGDCLIDALRSAFAERRGFVDGPLVGETAYAVEFLYPGG